MGSTVLSLLPAIVPADMPGVPALAGPSFIVNTASGSGYQVNGASSLAAAQLITTAFLGTNIGAAAADAASFVGSLTGGLAGYPATIGPDQWGIFSNGAPVLTVDSVASIEYARDYRVSDFQQEQGAFASYDKIQLPYQAKVGFLINQSRFAFLNEIEAILASLNLVSLVTPEITYANANLVHYDYRRTQRNGVTMILVNVWCEEIRVVGGAQLSNAQAQNAQGTQDNGAVQAQTTMTQPPALGGTLGLDVGSAGPAFYTGDNLPTVPNAAAQLTSQQQGTIASYGGSIDATSGTASIPDGEIQVNTVVTYAVAAP